MMDFGHLEPVRIKYRYVSPTFLLVLKGTLEDKIVRYFLLLFLFFISPEHGNSQERVSMVLGTVGSGPGERINISHGQLLEEHPGWFIELSQRAANKCGADIDFAFMPWARVLKQVENGALAGGFNSSYRPEREAYGKYPMLNGKPDERRASKHYGYYAYARHGTDKLPPLANLSVVVERGASIIPELKKRGAVIREAASYTSMLRVLAGRRVTLAVGIGRNLDPIIRRDFELSTKVKKLKPALLKKVGYVMFSKKFYASHGSIAECFWETSAQLRETPWFMDLQESYWQQQ
jgi:polar amino acid transport system substrate-binding protein